ncbi:hypothetical protein J2Y60_001006 [Arcicella sp. BE140]|nr:hypothetical protein [Arcicella sp. BE51]MDR6810821.1 hypothetical protein [Arcicella sp. BE140]MDR6822171.1 hypothetical protein [Arcicella sp. BE139]
MPSNGSIIRLFVLTAWNFQTFFINYVAYTILNLSIKTYSSCLVAKMSNDNLKHYKQNGTI